MRLLFDQNLSPRLVDRLKDVFPQALHVSQVGLSRAPDEVLWDYARTNALVICTKDTDFLDMSVLNGFPFRSTSAFIITGLSSPFLLSMFIIMVSGIPPHTHCAGAFVRFLTDDM